ncbi:MerT mercuric transport protein [Pseudoruegeria aquimaris]|uniref:MerT mercuric transport protein n=1 Tax=Pseudoruegeria aquimaris TaxID=393663 RepID=A0A1Y5TGN1_9RHOB|nr:hypothetical protein [Pseudoruegeria aquimaris]SLN63452.1 MerT mercuric transport protein [Pseudoruegeria aquimaris]
MSAPFRHAEGTPARTSSGVKASLLASFAALGVATCCVLPMIFLILGLGGSWLAVFGVIAGASPYVLALAGFLLAAAWIGRLRLDVAPGWARAGLWGSTALFFIALGLYAYEARINDALIQWM